MALRPFWILDNGAPLPTIFIGPMLKMGRLRPSEVRTLPEVTSSWSKVVVGAVSAGCLSRLLFQEACQLDEELWTWCPGAAVRVSGDRVPSCFSMKQPQQQSQLTRIEHLLYAWHGCMKNLFSVISFLQYPCWWKVPIYFYYTNEDTEGQRGLVTSLGQLKDSGE